MDAVVIGRCRSQPFEEGNPRIVATDCRRVERSTHEQYAILAEQTDSATRADGESVVKRLKEAKIDRGRRDAGEAAIGIADTPRQQYRPTAGGARYNRGVDAKLLVRMGLVKLEIVPVAVVVVLCRTNRGKPPPAILVQNDHFAQLRQFVRICREQLIEVIGLRRIALTKATDDV